LIENCAPVSRLVKDKRAAIYAKLEGEIKVLTAQRLYRHFEETGLDGVTEAVYAEEFCVDDHSFWEELQDKEKPEKNDKKERQEREEALNNLQKKWEEKAGRVLREIEASGAKAGKGLGNLVKIGYLQQDVFLNCIHESPSLTQFFSESTAHACPLQK
jgi:predicted ribosome quality control (RQC) complex YloA/Tae2 family protein